MGNAIDDEDPTGVRALLAAAPDPAPMPADLVQRISAALDEERRRGPATPASQSSPTSADSVAPRVPGASVESIVSPWGLPRRLDAPSVEAPASVSLLDDARARRERREFARSGGRHRLLLGSAAAVAAVGMLGFAWANVTLEKSQPQSSIADTAARFGDLRHLGGSASSPSGSASAAPTGIYLRHGVYTSGTLQQKARDLATTTAATIPWPTANAQSIGPIGTQIGLQACLRAAGVDPASGVRADLSTYNGTAAVVIVSGLDKDASGQVTPRANASVVVMPRLCSASSSPIVPSTPLR